MQGITLTGSGKVQGSMRVTLAVCSPVYCRVQTLDLSAL